MLSTGNSTVAICTTNLLTLQAGEVHLDQQRGITPAIIDAPATVAVVNLQAAAFRTLENYEPRVTFDDIGLTAAQVIGDFETTAAINQ